MSICNLMAKFEGHVNLPIEIADIKDAILELGVQERVVFSPQKMDPKEARGAYVRWTEHPAPYGEPDRVSLIVYSDALDRKWQRLICCKEATHIFDKRALRPTTPEEVIALAENLVGPLSTEEYGLAEAMGAADRLAIYCAVALLFPDAARDMAIAEIEAGRKTVDEIADWASIPVEFVRIVVAEDWLELKQIVLGNF